MKHNQIERWAYAKPAVETIRLEPHSELMDTSFPSQHQPGQPGTGPMPSSAKQNFFDDFDEDEIDDIPQSQPL